MLLILLACGASPSVEPQPCFELVVRGALEPGGALHSIAVTDGTIAEISTDELRGERELTAEVVTPGLIDAHAHPMSLGRSLRTLDLGGVSSFEALGERVRERECSTTRDAADRTSRA